MRYDSIAKKTDGFFYLRVPVAGTKRRAWISTGERDINRARAVVEQFGADRLVHLAHARAITQETIAIATVGRQVTWMEVVTLWLEWVQRRVSPNTAGLYLKYIRQLLDLYGAHQQAVHVLTEQQLNEYVNDGNCALETARSRLSALRSIYRWANAKGFVVGNPAGLIEVDHRQMSMAQKETTHHPPVTEEQYRLLLDGLPRPQRDWVVLAYCCGLRLGDVLCLEYASFTAQHIIVWIAKSRIKTPKRLLLPLTDPLIARPELQQLIADLLAERPAGDRASPYVWPLHRNRYLSPYAPNYSTHMKTRMKRAGVPERTFHSLRTSFARRLEAAGKTIEQIAIAMAHDSVDTTAVYLGFDK